MSTAEENKKKLVKIVLNIQNEQMLISKTVQVGIFLKNS